MRCEIERERERGNKRKWTKEKGEERNVQRRRGRERERMRWKLGSSSKKGFLEFLFVCDER